ncbi:MAG: hypothetical protein QNJ98_04770 [Planctomycetota bacterium]|nr:hypothetical protein [Planctomycetota bacterium]
MSDAEPGRRMGPSGASQPTDDEIRDLIRRAEAHDLGLRFLQRGAQDAVAATFGVHAFVVDAARKRLAL